MDLLNEQLPGSSEGAASRPVGGPAVWLRGWHAARLGASMLQGAVAAGAARAVRGRHLGRLDGRVRAMSSRPVGAAAGRLWRHFVRCHSHIRAGGLQLLHVVGLSIGEMLAVLLVLLISMLVGLGAVLVLLVLLAVGVGVVLRGLRLPGLLLLRRRHGVGDGVRGTNPLALLLLRRRDGIPLLRGGLVLHACGLLILHSSLWALVLENVLLHRLLLRLSSRPSVGHLAGRWR
jgi:hypothetical protein